MLLSTLQLLPWGSNFISFSHYSHSFTLILTLTLMCFWVFFCTTNKIYYKKEKKTLVKKSKVYGGKTICSLQ